MKITKDGLFSLFLFGQLVLSSFLVGCNNVNTIKINAKIRPAGVAATNASITNIQVVNHQVVITGTNLSAIDTFAITEGSTTTSMAIETKSNTSIVANTLSNVTFAAGKIFNFILSNAHGASTFTVNFSLCDSDLNGRGFNCSITPNDKDVLSYDANTNKWIPRNVNGLSYKGTLSAVGGTDPGGSPANGDYFIISAAGTISGVSYAIGDWIVYNSDDTVWQKISNSRDVISVFGRTGKVSAKEGDYNITKLSDVDTTTSPPAINDILKFNGTNWIPGTVTSTETDPTVSPFAKAALPTCGAGQVLRSNGSILSCVADGSFTGTANRVVVTNGTGALTISGITDTILNYLSGLTGNVQTQLNLKADSASIVDYSVAGLPLIHSTRVYGGAAQANRTLVTDGSGTITTSTVTPTELGYLAGATSNIQNQLNTLNGTGHWVKTGSDLSYSGGKVGVGVTTPTESFETTGAIKVGVTASTCTAANKGTIRYNNTTNVLEFCNGSGWNLVQAAACSDGAPDVFSFTPEANASLNTLTVSDIIQISGINCLVPVTISSTGSPQYQICADAACASVVQSWTSSPSNISTGQYIQVRLTTDNVGGSTSQATLYIGSGATTWNVTTTGSCVGSPAPGTVCADGTIYVGQSPDGNVPMFTTRCDAGMTWSGSSCTGSRLALSWNNGVTNFSTGVISSSAGKTNSATLNGSSDAGAPYYSANFCESLNVNGHTDWYLPALNEFIVMHSSRAAIKNFAFAYYWTSTENGFATAFGVRGDGIIEYPVKFSTLHVRCVRR